jgi:hypothetical protein
LDVAEALRHFVGGPETGARNHPKAPMTMVEYTCEGCGVHVVSASLFHPPDHGFCVQCAFLCEFIPDPVEMIEVRKRLDDERKNDVSNCPAQ